MPSPLRLAYTMMGVWVYEPFQVVYAVMGVWMYEPLQMVYTVMKVSQTGENVARLPFVCVYCDSWKYVLFDKCMEPSCLRCSNTFARYLIHFTNISFQPKLPIIQYLRILYAFILSSCYGYFLILHTVL